MKRISQMMILIVAFALVGTLSAQREPRDPDPTEDRGRFPAVTSDSVTPESTQEAQTEPDDGEDQDDDEDTREANTHAIEIRASDGARLAGEYFDGGTTAVLLLHELYTTHLSWGEFIGTLQGSGYSVLAVDLRGYGASHRSISWQRAQQDTLDWVEWLTEEHDIRQVILIGSSMGANLALVGCAESEYCSEVVALSPGLHYFGVYTEDAITSGISALLIYAEGDPQPAREVPLMLKLAEENGSESVTALAYPGRAHGMALFESVDDLTTEILAWLRGA